MILEALHKVANHGTSLSREEAHGVMSEILRGEATHAQIAGLLVGLHMKGETVEEIVGFALRCATRRRRYRTKMARPST